VALLFDKLPNKGIYPWRNADLLVRFRNRFMHFRPSWDTDDIQNDNLVKELRQKIIVAAYAGSKFLFPQGLMTYGCAKWAVHLFDRI
jgi:hypothetical protein